MCWRYSAGAFGVAAFSIKGIVQCRVEGLVSRQTRRQVVDPCLHLLETAQDRLEEMPLSLTDRALPYVPHNRGDRAGDTRHGKWNPREKRLGASREQLEP